MTIFWFRRDLRLDDNIGLFHALNSNEYPIFIFDKQYYHNYQRMTLVSLLFTTYFPKFKNNWKKKENR